MTGMNVLLFAAGDLAQAEPFLALAARKVTDFQKSAALEQAALQDRKASFIDQIPIDSVKKTAQMQNLLANFQAAEVVKQFGAEDFSKWPFWKRGAGEAYGRCAKS